MKFVQRGAQSPGDENARDGGETSLIGGQSAQAATESKIQAKVRGFPEQSMQSGGGAERVEERETAQETAQNPETEGAGMRGVLSGKAERSE